MCFIKGIAHLLDDGQNPWLVLVVSVSAHTQVHFLRINVGLVRSSELEDTEIAL